MTDTERTAFEVVRRREAGKDGGEPDGGLFAIEESLGYLMNYAARAFSRELSPRLAAHGARMGQWAVLMFLWAQDGQTQRELSREVAIEDATMVRTLDRMERDGLVRRERNPRDRRQINIFLTEKGWALRDTLVPEAIEGNRSASRRLSEDERRQLLDLLGRVIGALEEQPRG
ncbi:MarR family winged helix-turn-helix transcriptional regulator [uncultured Arthrobacter sp.]|uniref:MarR family winged helix-turn-helix transcriptional regulator n=1 Tax=uncultured Arthrobacter sp. TaxID=114050 RepID=UPI0025F7917A|nr:MarR family winged helix-turn-helix transcriptional regulator [uncultured Arthrobacter sp.]